MITNIGVISREILNLLKCNNGLFVFGDLQSSLNRSHDCVTISLGWLLGEGDVRVLEDPLRVSGGIGPRHVCDVFMFDLIVDNKFEESTRARIKNVTQTIMTVSDKVLTLVEGCEDLLPLQTIERSLHESRDMILMSLGWLIGKECVRGINAAQDIYIYPISKENNSPIGRVMKEENLICV